MAHHHVAQTYVEVLADRRHPEGEQACVFVYGGVACLVPWLIGTNSALTEPNDCGRYLNVMETIPTPSTSSTTVLYRTKTSACVSMVLGRLLEVVVHCDCVAEICTCSEPKALPLCYNATEPSNEPKIGMTAKMSRCLTWFFPNLKTQTTGSESNSSANLVSVVQKFVSEIVKIIS